MDNEVNGFRSTVLGIGAALGISAVTGLVGWLFFAESSNSRLITEILIRQQGVLEVNSQQTKRMEEIERQSREETKELEKRLRELENWKYFSNMKAPPT